MYTYHSLVPPVVTVVSLCKNLSYIYFFVCGLYLRAWALGVCLGLVGLVSNVQSSQPDPSEQWAVRMKHGGVRVAAILRVYFSQTSNLNGRIIK